MEGPSLLFRREARVREKLCKKDDTDSRKRLDRGSDATARNQHYQRTDGQTDTAKVAKRRRTDEPTDGSISWTIIDLKSRQSRQTHEIPINISGLFF